MEVNRDTEALLRPDNTHNTEEHYVPVSQGPFRSSSGPLTATRNSELDSAASANISWPKWIGMLSLSIPAVFIEFLFSYFLWLSVNSSITDIDNGIVKEFTGNTNGWVKTLNKVIKYILGSFVVANLIGDITAVDPIQDSYEFLTDNTTFADRLAKLTAPKDKPEVGGYESWELEDKKRWVEENLNWGQKKLPQIMLWIHRLIILVTNFSVLSLSDAISVGSLAKNDPAALGIGTAVSVILGSTYYTLLTDRQIQIHMIRFFTKLCNTKESMLINALKTPLLSSEAFFEIFCTASYRCIAAMYIFYTYIQLSATSFAGNDHYNLKPLSSLILMVGICTFETTLFSRSLSTIDKVFPDVENQYITQAKRNGLPKAKTAMSMISILLRALSTGHLSYSSLDHQIDNVVTRAFVGGIIGVIVLLHGVHTNLKIIRRGQALELQDKAEKTAAGFHNQTTLDDMSSTELFDLIGKEFNGSKMDTIISVINGMAQTARHAAFIGFLWTLVEKFMKKELNIDLGLKATGVLDLSTLIGILIALNSYGFYDPELKSVWTNYATKIEIWRKAGQYQLSTETTSDLSDEEAGLLNGRNDSHCCSSGVTYKKDAKIRSLLFAPKGDLARRPLREIAKNLPSILSMRNG